MILLEKKTPRLTRTQAEEFSGRLLRMGEDLDAVDLTVFFAWLFAAYHSLEPFPQLHAKLRERCLDSFSLADQQLTAGLALLQKALFKTEAGRQSHREKKYSFDRALALPRQPRFSVGMAWARSTSSLALESL